DALEKFMLDESSLTSPHSNPQQIATYHLQDLEANLRKLEEQKQRLEEQGADLTEITQPQAEQENQAWTNQNAYHLANVDKCKRVLEQLPATSEPFPEEIITEDTELFTQLVSILEEVVKKLEGQEQLEAELQEVKREKQELETKLQQQESTLNQLKEKLEQATNELAWQTLNLEAANALIDFFTKAFKNSENLTTRGEELKQKEIDKITSFVLEKEGSEQKLKELEGQLAGLVVSSGLLSQQVEQLNNQLSEREQEVEQKRLESEIKANLIREQSEKISQQTNQLTNYQNLLRTAEENLKKGQELLRQKEKQLEELEKEKNLIGEKLELASGKIEELEGALRGANGKISQLEARIKDLESKGDNSSELERLKKELATERQKHQQEINRLKQELQQTKLREEQLAQKIKGLSTKKGKIAETTESVSFWATIKKPLLYTSDKNTGQINDWEYQKKQAKREAEAEKNKEWFKEGRWLTDKEIDWASERMEKNERFKILPAHQFYLAKEAKRKDDLLIFKELLKEINDSNKELIFIPVNQPNYHWSLLGANDKYIKPLVSELIEQIQVIRSISEDYLARYLIKKYEIRQNNG
ncbi:11358_t:CDS:2, partial [Cetraspora pellucida]